MIRTMTLATCLIVFGITIFCCAESRFTGQKGEVTVPENTIGDVLKEHAKELMSVPGVVGTAEGLCDDRPCIKVYVVKRSMEIDKKIPGTLEGYPVKIEVTGELRTMPENRN
jgi:predicted NodU family carbamoyl transferase